MEEEFYLKAGKIAKKIKESLPSLIKDGKNLKELANEIEEMIKKEGAEIAFPVNIGVNEIGAHYTPVINEERVVNLDDLIKIDIGLHIEGCIADFAISITKNEEYKELIKIVEKACREGCKIAKPGVKVKEISEIIEKEIVEKGAIPIANLTGHGLKKYELHAKPSIPNVKNTSDYELKENEVIAIEPFASFSCNWVKEEKRSVIFFAEREGRVRNEVAKEIIKLSRERRYLPLCERWFENKYPLIKIRIGLKELREKNILYEYPILKGEGIIAQWENSVIVKDKPIVFTED